MFTELFPQFFLQPLCELWFLVRTTWVFCFNTFFLFVHLWWLYYTVIVRTTVCEIGRQCALLVVYRLAV
jgi:hypothetical protein